jgi:septum formation protein
MRGIGGCTIGDRRGGQATTISMNEERIGTSVVLASQSPRRRALLAALGVAFVVDAADVDESARPGELPPDLVMRLSREKALSVAARHPGATVLAADTIVVLDGAILGKPAGADEAQRMLQALRSQTHQVLTAVSVARDDTLVARCSECDVTMRPYDDREIEAYVATGDPLDKAGAYAIQHPAFAPVASWTGCYTSIMGLPLGVAADLLACMGEAVPQDVAGLCESLGGRCCLRPDR